MKIDTTGRDNSRMDHISEIKPLPTQRQIWNLASQSSEPETQEVPGADCSWCVLAASLRKWTQTWMCASFTVAPHENCKQGSRGWRQPIPGSPLVLSPGTHVSFFLFLNASSLSLALILEFFTERVKNLEVPCCSGVGQP